jgi:hypothetical protein
MDVTDFGKTRRAAWWGLVLAYFELLPGKLDVKDSLRSLQPFLMYDASNTSSFQSTFIQFTAKICDVSQAFFLVVKASLFLSEIWRILH